jgi:hypothetical protein
MANLPDGAPYDPATLPDILTPVQRQKIKDWVGKEIVKKGISINPKPGPNINDHDLKQVYATVLGLVGWTDTGITGPGGKSTVQVPNPLKGLTDFLNLLLSAQLWVRILEVAIGLLLLGVGLAKLTGASNAISKVAAPQIAAVRQHHNTYKTTGKHNPVGKHAK